MKRGILAAFLVLVLAAGFWMWRLRPAQQVAGRLHDLIETVNFDQPLAPLARAKRAQRLGGFFAPEGKINIQAAYVGTDYSLVGPESIRENYLGVSGYLPKLLADWTELEVRVSGRNASVRAMARVDAGDQIAKFWPLRIELRKTSGEWLISSIVTLQILNR